MRRFLVLVLGLVVFGVFAGQALAANGSGGYVEICKYSTGSPAVVGQFKFTLTDSVGSTWPVVSVGTCTAPLPVAPGSVSVTEQGALTGISNDGTSSSTLTTTFLNTPSITVTSPSGSSSLSAWSTGSITVPASPGDTSQAVTAAFTNSIDPGVVEVCKDVVSTSGLSGSWTYAITGGNGFSGSASVPAGSCSGPIVVPAGNVKVVESGIQNVTSVSATNNAGNALVSSSGVPSSSSSYANPYVVASVVAGNATQQTLVHFVNNSVTLKVCKVVGSTGLLGPYQFTWSSSGAAGPIGSGGTFTLTPSAVGVAVCMEAGPFRAGTQVNLQEGIVPGTKVGSIAVSPSSWIVPSTLDLPDRSVSVYLGPAETDVTYTDVPADPGSVKICKVIGTSTPAVVAGTLFKYTLTPAGGSPTTVMVPAGSCADPISFPYDTTVSVVETLQTGTTVLSIATNPSPLAVQVLEGGSLVATSQQALTGVNLTAGSANVTVGENYVTEVNFTNIDPPPASTGGGGGGSSAGSGGSSASSGSSSSSASSAPAVTPVVSSVPAVVKTNSAATVKTALLAKLNKQLANMKLKVKVLVKKQAKAKTLAQKRALAKQIRVLLRDEAKLARIISKVKLS